MKQKEQFKQTLLSVPRKAEVLRDNFSNLATENATEKHSVNEVMDTASIKSSLVDTGP